MDASPATSLLDGYPCPSGVYDEMFTSTGEVRPHYQAAHRVLTSLSDQDVLDRDAYVGNMYLEQGITFDLGGREEPFPLDVVPRIIPADDFAIIEAGIAQRVTVLEKFLADVYSVGAVFADGVMPRKLVVSSAHYHRVAHGIQPANGVRIHVSGTDLVRGADGRLRVLEDNARVPSGVSYVMTNRRAITSAFPEMFGQYRVRPVAHYPALLLDALRAAAPRGVSDPTVVVLTPGIYNSAYFEHALLARTMGVPLVEAGDLVSRNGRIMARTTRGLRRVDVIYRRLDDDFVDPAHFRPESLLGVAGLMSAARAGNVTIANAVGNGVADDKLTCTYVDDLIRYYLGEEPILPGVKTWRLENKQDLEEVMDRLDEVVVKPVDGSGGKGVVIGPQASREELEQLRHEVLADPRRFIAQPVVQLSTVPTMIDGQVRPRHVDLRPFAVNDGQKVHVLPGGLTRVALQEGRLIVNSSQGGGSKDTWVLADSRVRPVSAEPAQGFDKRHPSLLLDDEEDPNSANPMTRPLMLRAVHQAQRDLQTQSQSSSGRSQSQSQSGGRERTRSMRSSDLMAGGPWSAPRQTDLPEATSSEILLSRIADSLFWVSRYLQRAETTSRMLAANVQHVDDSPAADQELVAGSLLAALGERDRVPVGQPIDMQLVLHRLMYDSDAPSSLRSTVGHAREAARRVREIISIDTWEAINTLYLETRRPAFSRIPVQQALSMVRNGAVMAVGSARHSMIHDEGYSFMQLGQALEGVDMTARLIHSAIMQAPTPRAWLNALSAAGGYQSFVRTNIGEANEREAAHFLILNTRFPGSLVYGLNAIERTLRELEPQPLYERRDEALHKVGRIKSHLEYEPMEEDLSAIGERMELVQATCDEISELVTRRYLTVGENEPWTKEPSCV